MLDLLAIDFDNVWRRVPARPALFGDFVFDLKPNKPLKHYTRCEQLNHRSTKTSAFEKLSCTSQLYCPTCLRCDFLLHGQCRWRVFSAWSLDWLIFWWIYLLSCAKFNWVNGCVAGKENAIIVAALNECVQNTAGRATNSTKHYWSKFISTRFRFLQDFESIPFDILKNLNISL